MSWKLTKSPRDRTESGRGLNKKQRGEAKGSAEADEEMDSGADLSDLMSHMQLLTKQVLANTQQIRQIFSALTTTALLPSKSEVAKAGVEAGHDYNQATQGKAKHGRGPPFPYVFGAMLEALARQESEAKEWLAKLATALDGHKAGHLVIAEFVTICQCKEARKKEGEQQFTIVTVGFDPFAATKIPGIDEAGFQLVSKVKTNFWTALKACEGTDLRTGPAPRGQMERLLQTRLKKMEK